MNVEFNYSRAERWLHQLAFSGVEVQKALADIEDRIYADALKKIPLVSPIFIAGLPRSGTTMLLDALATVPGLASNTYRDMPFVLCPLLWDQVSRPFRKSAQSRERMHGDGVAVSEDSPEAFEEVVWQAFWPKKYKGEIGIWRAGDRSREFEDFLRSHMRKTIALHSDAHGPPRRYLSKNNANIARLTLLPALFGDCRIVVPFRNPADHCASLQAQHKRFLAIQQQPFARAYMKYLGHYEFGHLLKPIAFPDTPDDISTAEDPDFWLAYWAAAYRSILSGTGGQVVLLDYDALCANPADRLKPLLAALALDPSVAQSLSARFRTPSEHAASAGSKALIEAANEVHRALVAAATLSAPPQVASR
ncbi:MAG: sulfotransferase [Proteobacteria bacterium]|nr:sulfotransferase [Pseudomonadota bacterium]